MSLLNTLCLINESNQRAGHPTDLRTGTVTSASPLEITINTQMAPLKAPTLILTEAVVEKKIPVLEHTHGIHDTYTGGGSCDPALLESQILCQEHGQALPVEDGYIILNRALEVGDRVLLLRVENGQRFLVLSRVFEVA